MATYSKKLLFILFLPVLVLYSCGREDSLEELNGDSITFPLLQSQVDLTVTVVAKSGTAVQGARVTVGSQQKVTDPNGIVRLKDIVRTNAGYTIKVAHDGYLPEVIFVPYDNKELDLQQTIVLTSKAVSRLTANTNETAPQGFSIGDGNVQIDDENAKYILPNGSSYSGSVVYHGYVNYVGAPAVTQLPPARLATDNSLFSFLPEMTLRLEAYSTNDLPLGLENGTYLRVVVSQSTMEDNTPTALDVVRVNSTSGLYTRITDAESAGNGTALNLRKMGTYHLGSERTSVAVQMTIHTNNSVPVANVPVTLNVEGMLMKVGTDALGRLSVEVPEDTEVKLQVQLCTVDETVQLGSFQEDIDLDIVQLSVSGSPIQGNVSDCLSSDGLLGYIGANQQQIGLFGPDGIIVGTWLCEQDTLLIDITTTNTLSENTLKDIYWGDLSGTPIAMGQVNLPCDYILEICGTFRYDEDDDGIAESTTDAGARFLNEVFLLGPIDIDNLGTTPSQKTAIASDGSYCLSNLLPGLYEVRLMYTDPAAAYQYYSSGTNFLESGDGSASIQLNLGPQSHTLDIDYNKVAPGSISGSISWDTNGDGLGDTPNDGLKVWLRSDTNNDGLPDGVVAETVPNAQGLYQFDNVINTSYVLEVRPIGDEIVSGTDDSPDDAFEVVDDPTNELIPVFLQRGEIDGDNNYIVRFESGTTTASISGSVLVDTDGDGVGDIGYSGEFILLNHRDANGLPTSGSGFEEQVTMTALDGSFSFDNIPAGEYVLTSTGNIEGPGGFGAFTRVSDKDETPEAGEVMDTEAANSHILVDLPMDGQDSDNLFIIRY